MLILGRECLHCNY